jgi:hypothetical protein
MRRLIAASFALVAFLFTFWGAPALAASPFAGVWTLVSYTSEQDKRESVLTVTDAGGAVAVSIALPAGGTVPAGGVAPTFKVSDVAVKGDILTFKAAVDLGAQGVVNVEYTLTFSGDTLTGTGKANGGERKLLATRRK